MITVTGRSSSHGSDRTAELPGPATSTNWKALRASSGSSGRRTWPGFGSHPDGWTVGPDGQLETVEDANGTPSRYQNLGLNFAQVHARYMAGLREVHHCMPP